MEALENNAGLKDTCKGKKDSIREESPTRWRRTTPEANKEGSQEVDFTAKRR